jgi:lipopolysaccharide/colanic/teichoic acid biosynthesis glycosyltransferase
MIKRSFDVIVSFAGIIFFGWIVFLFWVILTFLGKTNGMFVQERIGYHGKPFNIYKLRTVFNSPSPFLNRLARFLRNSKIDELPQLWNVLRGDMSMVGPRPDVAGYYDVLTDDDKKVLDLRPGITGPASIKYYNEEKLLALKENPKKYNDEVIFPDKVRINLEYAKSMSFWLDVRILLRTAIGEKPEK